MLSDEPFNIFQIKALNEVFDPIKNVYNHIEMTIQNVFRSKRFMCMFYEVAFYNIDYYIMKALFFKIYLRYHVKYILLFSK